ncbi:MAG TPA: hypothetical protein H9929_07750, partial [Candidatus Alistipes excrementavium]|nr:hypothetical protein [Candidatus Alistipes excrementavium]
LFCKIFAPYLLLKLSILWIWALKKILRGHLNLLDSPFALIRKVAADEKYENDFAFNEKTAGSDSSLRRMNAMKRQSPLLRPAVPAADPFPLSNRRSETDTPVPTHSFRPAIETMSLPFLNLWPHSSFRP